MSTQQRSAHTTDDPTTFLDTPEAAGELRQRMRDSGWRGDLAWAEVGARSAAGAVRAADGEDVRRTIAYLPSLRAVDGGTSRLWKDGDVPVPPVADVREVLRATEGVDEWLSELFECPPERVAPVDEDDRAGVAA